MENALYYIGAYITVALVFLAVWYILQVVAMWKIFTKAGVAGWKSIIPFYNEYCLFRISWKNATYALVYLITFLVGSIGTSYCSTNAVTGVLPTIFNLISLVGIILAVVRNFKEAKAFGHGAGFGFGLTFLTPIFNLIIAFSNDKYLGAQD